MSDQNDFVSMFKGLIPNTEPTEQDLRIKQKAAENLEILLNESIYTMNPSLITILYQISKGV